MQTLGSLNIEKACEFLRQSGFQPQQDPDTHRFNFHTWVKNEDKIHVRVLNDTYPGKVHLIGEGS